MRGPCAPSFKEVLRRYELEVELGAFPPPCCRASPDGVREGGRVPPLPVSLPPPRQRIKGPTEPSYNNKQIL